MDDTLELVDVKYSNNPWNVTSIYEFYYFCCPECDCKLQNKQDFVNHASNDHPWVSISCNKNFEFMYFDFEENLKVNIFMIWP